MRQTQVGKRRGKALKAAQRPAWQTYQSFLGTEDVPLFSNHQRTGYRRRSGAGKTNWLGLHASDGGLPVRGSVDYQITRIFNESCIFCPGTSRHREKDSVRKELAAHGQPASSEAIAEGTGLHSYTYARDCKDTWHQFARFAKEVLHVRDMTTLDARATERFLLQRIQDGISYETWRKEAAHIGKLENALCKWRAASGDTRERTPGIRKAALDPELRRLAREQLSRSGKEFGHFEQPESVIAHMVSVPQPEFILASRIQFEGGARCREACQITEKQLRGTAPDPLTGTMRGHIHLTDTKGGKPRTIQIGTQLYADLESAIEDSNGIFYVSMSSYAKAVRIAARAVGETLGGTHAFRYCFARNRYWELTGHAPKGAGLTHEAAIQQVSWEMGHERADVTLLYLR